jgi:hypothetical protein
MPVSSALFAAQPAPYRVAKDGQCYGTLTGEAGALFAICPDLFAPLESLGGEGVGLDMNALLDALGRVVAIDDAAANHKLGQYHIAPAFLGGVLEKLLRTAKATGQAAGLRRPAQLRCWFETLHQTALTRGDIQNGDFTVGHHDLSPIAAMVPAEVPAPADAVVDAEEASSGDDKDEEAPPTTPGEAAGLRTVAPWMASIVGCELTFGHLCPDGAATHLGAFLRVAGPRSLAGNRDSTGGLVWVTNHLVRVILADMSEFTVNGVRGLALPDWMDATDCAAEAGKLFLSVRPAALLEGFPSGLIEARRMFQQQLRTGGAASLDVTNILYAVNQLPTLVFILGNNEGEHYCRTPPAEALGAVRTLARALDITGAVAESDLGEIAARLRFLATAFAASDTPAELQPRLIIALSKLAERTEERKISSKGSAGGGADTRTGYPRQFQGKLYDVLANANFVKDVAELELMMAEDSGCHPHDCIHFIFEKAWTILFHALFGKKDWLALLPVVKMIADRLRPFGPTYLGQAAMEIVMPKSMRVDAPTRVFPSLEKIWAQLCKGDVAWDLENEVFYKTQGFYAGGSVGIVPADEVYRSATRLTALLAHVAADHTGLHARIGIGGVGTVVQAALSYYFSAGHMKEDVRRRNMQAYINGVLKEYSTIFARELLQGDPTAVLFGPIVVPSSPAALTFQTHVRGLGPAMESIESMRAAGLGHLLPQRSIVPEDLGAAGAPAAGGAAAAGPAAAAVSVVAAAPAVRTAPVAVVAAAPAAAPAPAGSNGWIGSKADKVKIDWVNRTLSFHGVANETFCLKKLYATPGVSSSACAATLCSRSPRGGAAFCQHAGKKGHETAMGGAHAFPADFKTRILQTLLLAANVAGASGSSVGAAAPSFYADAGEPAHALLPLILGAGGTYVGLPGGGHRLFGAVRSFQGREPDFADAGRWSARLFGPGVESFYLFEMETIPIVVSGVLVSSAPPLGWEGRVATDAGTLARAPAGSICWAPLAALRCNETIHTVAAIAFARADTFRCPAPALSGDAVVGAMREQLINPRRALLKARARTVPWEEVVRRGEAAVADQCAELTARIAAERDGEVRRDLEGWRAICNQPLRLSEIDEALRSSCYNASDKRLWLEPFPHVGRVATAPLAALPGPPPYERVPAYALSWKEVLRPHAHAGALKHLLALRAFYRHVALHGTLAGAQAPRFWSCGADSFFDWAAELVREGHVLIRRDGRITLLDQSQAPEFTLDPGFAAELLRDSPDAALRDALTTHGVVFFANLDPQVVLCPPMQSIATGLASVQSALGKMIQQGWFLSVVADGLDDGVLELGSVPGRHQAVGCVAKKFTTEMRMIVNNSYPHATRPMYTSVGTRAPVVSLNDSTGAQLDKATRRREVETRGAAAAGMPAVGPLGDAARLRRRPPTAPSQCSIQRLAGRPEYVTPPCLPGSGGAAAVLPPEFKPFFFELVVAITILAAAGETLGLVPVLFSDDLAKFFHQFALARLQRWTSHIAILDPAAVTDLDLEALLADAPPAEIAVLSELCMSMGTRPSSNYAQRYSTELMLDFEERFHAAHGELYSTWASANSAFCEWSTARSELGKTTGRCESRLLKALAYTDDPIFVTLGSATAAIPPLVQGAARLLVDAAVDWGRTCRAAGIARADPIKRHYGVQTPWVGANVLTTGLIAYLDKAKVLRAQHGLRAAARGELSVSAFRELAGLLHHIVFTVALPMHVMYNLYDGLDQLRGRAPVVPTLRCLFLCGGPGVAVSVAGLGVAASIVGLASGVVITSHDVADGVQHDLLAPALQAAVLRAVAAGEYDFVYGSPPCGPTLGAAGARLVLFVIKALAVAATHGVAWGLEHPAPRNDTVSPALAPPLPAGHATVWHDPAMQRLADCDTAACIDVADRNIRGGLCANMRVLGHRHFVAALETLLGACAPHTGLAGGRNAVTARLSEAAAAWRASILSAASDASALLAREAALVRDSGDVDDVRLVPVTPRSRVAIKEWCAALGARSGTSMLATFFDSSAPKGAVRHTLHSDAAIKGTLFPAVASNLYGHFCVFPLAGTGYLALPIVALEFFGCALGLIAFDDLLQDAVEIVLPCDSLVAPTVLASRARGSLLLQHMHKKFLELPVVKRLLDQLSASHEYGVGNPITDMFSRGRAGEAAQVMRHLGLEPTERRVPQAAVDYLDDALAFHRSLPAKAGAEPDWLHLAKGTRWRPDARAEVTAPARGARGGDPELDLGPYPFGAEAIEFMGRGPVCGVSDSPVLAPTAASPAGGGLALPRRLAPEAPSTVAVGAPAAVPRPLLVRPSPAGGWLALPRRLAPGAPSTVADCAPMAVPRPLGPLTPRSRDRALACVPQDQTAVHGLLRAPTIAPQSLLLAPTIAPPSLASSSTWPRSGGAARAPSVAGLRRSPVRPSRLGTVACAGRARGPAVSLGRSLASSSTWPRSGGAARAPSVAGLRRSPVRPSRLGTVACAGRARGPAVSLGRHAQSGAGTVSTSQQCGSVTAAAQRRAGVGPPAAAPVGEGRRTAAWEEALLQDASPMALLHGDPEALAALLDDMRDCLDHAGAPLTSKGDAGHMKAWKAFCVELGTPCWRTDVAANSGVDPVGYRRELLLPALAFLRFYAGMSPRSKSDPAPNPRSALNKLYGVSREHKKRGYFMAPFTMASSVMAGMLRKYVAQHGADCLAPSRKNPLTNEMIFGMFDTPDGCRSGQLVVAWNEYKWISVKATFSVLAETGMRKADVSKPTKASPRQKGKLTFASLRWCINGERLAAPSAVSLRAIAHGDGCWLVFGILKNDAFGEFFGSKPAWLPYSAGAPRNACRALVALELAAAQAGLVDAVRSKTPLFGPALGQEWHHSLLDQVFVLLLRHGARLSVEACKGYSVHSFRIYLACALYAAKCPIERIMAILRWKSKEALLVYARMNDGERSEWVLLSMSQTVDSTVAAHLPQLDADSWVAALQESVRSGELGAAARAAEASGDVEDAA